MADEKNTRTEFPDTYTIRQYGEGYEVRPHLNYYTQVTDFMGEPRRNLAITLDDIHAQEQHAVLTVNLGEFIPVPNSAYIDINNNPGICAWLEENGIAKLTSQSRQSGYCTYPLAIFDEGFLKSMDDGTLAAYLEQFAPAVADADKAAWAICGRSERGGELWFFESHLTADEDAPSGEGYYFASWVKGKDGKWDEYGGGLYWGYDDARGLEEVIGETLPFCEYTYKEIPYSDFDAVCFNSDAAKESEYRKGFGIETVEHRPKEKTYEVTITETLKRTVQVRASSEVEAQDKVERGWKDGVHVLDADDFKEVHFTAFERQRDKGLER